MSAIAVLSHPVCHIVLGFLFTMGAFEYGAATLKTPRPGWRKNAILFCAFDAVSFYLLEYYILGHFPPSIAIFLCAMVLIPQLYFAAKDSFYYYFYLVMSLAFVMLMSYNLAILVARWTNMVVPGSLDIRATMAMCSIMYIFASMYLYFDTRMPFIKLENFNNLMHNSRGKYLLFYFLLFDSVMAVSSLFSRKLLFFENITGNTLFNLLMLMTLLNVLLLVSSFLIVLSLCRIESSVNRINEISNTAYVDELTGLLSRTGFVEKMDRSLSAGNGGAFFILDLDNFKTVNDTLGRQSGDRVLIDCASVMKQVFRSTDLIGRLSGDEFMAFAENLTDIEMIKTRGQALCDKLSFTVEEGRRSVKTGCSVGIVVDTKNRDFNKVHYEADKALYSAKIQGKNRYTISKTKPVMG